MANAATLYDDDNYSGASFTSTSRGTNGIPVARNDKASSLTNTGAETYCENSDCSGQTFSWTGNANALSAINSGLGLTQSWNDRISGIK